MALAGAIIKKSLAPSNTGLEMTEIGLFSAMWVVHSIERWGKILQPELAAPQEALST
ncbi:MAG TPA: hypothetical protein VNA57_01035 [Acidimicrobiales bacterium]|nr:hypothetical protein [Acidimicrobiales bacterium]